MASLMQGHEFVQASGVGDGQGSLACCSPWGHKDSDMTEQLNNKVLGGSFGAGGEHCLTHYTGNMESGLS